MIRLIISLLGLAVIFAVFAGVSYESDPLAARTRTPPTFQVAAGEAQQVRVQPTLAGTPISIEATVVGGPLDILVMPGAWADRLAGDGELNLSRPFSFDAALSRFAVNGTYSFALTSDGSTEYAIVLDNSDLYYLGDAQPNRDSATNGTAEVQLAIRYVEEQERSLTLGYLAAAPAVLLIVLTVGHRIWRHYRE